MASVNTQIPLKDGRYLPNNFATQDEQVSISFSSHFHIYQLFRMHMMTDKEEWLIIK